MDSYEFNKVIGALLGAVFVVFSVSIISDAIFAAPHPAQEGFAIEAVEPGGEGGGPEAPTEEPIAVLLASADIEAGQAVERRCMTCHTNDKGGANKVGPNLFDIVNRPIASHEGFSYSSALREFSEDGTVVWDYDHLNEFLKSPKGLVRGTAMAFAGLRNPQDRANLIAYLRTYSDDPVPLPEVPAPTENASAPGEGEADGQAAPAEEGAAPAEAAPADVAPSEAAPAETAPTQTAPTETAPAETAPAETAPAQEAPAPAAPTEAAPAGQDEAPATDAAPAPAEPAPETQAPAESETPAPVVPSPEPAQ